MTALEVYALCKKYTDTSVAGGGTIKGKNCTIQSIEPITGGNRVTFAWYIDGEDNPTTETMDVMDGVIPVIDTALDTTSTNAVENRAVAGEINSIKNDITVEGSASGDIATFVDGSDNPLKELKISIEAQQSGTGDPSPDNVRPISGFSAVDIARAGKNLWSFGNISGTKQVNVDLNMPIGLWTFSCEITSSDVESDTSLIVFQYDSGNSTYVRLQRGSRVSYSLTTTKVVKRISFYAGYNSTQSTGDTFAYSNIQLEIGNTATAYESYNGNIYNIDWQSTAGTVYGGTLDVLTGKLTVTHKLVDLGTLEWYISGASGTTGAHVYSSSITDRLFSASVIGMCSNYKWYGNAVLADLVNNLDNNSFGFYVGSVVLMIRDDTFIGKTRAEVKTALLGVQLVYELATPIEYDLTPTEIRSLLGLNNVWADCGSVTELKYTRDLNLCINDIIARIEALEGASRSVSPTLTKSIVSDSDKTEGKTEEETEEETKEEAQNEPEEDEKEEIEELKKNRI